MATIETDAKTSPAIACANPPTSKVSLNLFGRAIGEKRSNEENSENVQPANRYMNVKRAELSDENIHVSVASLILSKDIKMTPAMKIVAIKNKMAAECRDTFVVDIGV